MTERRLKAFVHKTLLFICIVLVVIVLNQIFGQDNILVTITLVTAVLMLYDLPLGLSCKSASLILLLLPPAIGVFTYAFSIPVWLSFFAHSVFILTIFVLTGPNYATKAYLPFMLGFVFLQANPVYGRAWFLRMLELFLGGVVLSIVYYARHRKKDESAISLGELVKTLARDVHARSFILRMSLGISLAFLIGNLLQVSKVLWITIVVLSLTQFSHQDMKLRMRHRVQANLIGYALFLALIHLLIPEHFYGLVCMILGYINSFVTEYKYQQIITTMNVLTISATTLGAGAGVLLRFCMLLCASGIVTVLSYAAYRMSPRLRQEGEVLAVSS